MSLHRRSEALGRLEQAPVNAVEQLLESPALLDVAAFAELLDQPAPGRVVVGKREHSLVTEHLAERFARTGKASHFLGSPRRKYLHWDRLIREEDGPRCFDDGDVGDPLDEECRLRRLGSEQSKCALVSLRLLQQRPCPRKLVRNTIDILRIAQAGDVKGAVGDEPVPGFEYEPLSPVLAGTR